MTSFTCPSCRQTLEHFADGEQLNCPTCGQRLEIFESLKPEEDAEVRRVAGKKIAAGICGILLGALGIHKFILGLTVPGIIMLLVSLLTCGFGAPVMGVIGLIEGIIYLTKSDEDFYERYVIEKRGWF